jgi:Na+/phosphate symporter
MTDHSQVTTMNEREYAQVTAEALESLGRTVEDLKKCLFSRNKRLLNEAKRNFVASVRASIPLFEETVEKKEKNELDRRLLELLPSLQRLGIAVEDLIGGVQIVLETEVSLTDKALGEINEMMALLKDLVRDTNDVLATKNANFRTYALSSVEHLLQRTCECELEHQERLVVAICSPKASFLYLDLMDSIKRITQELGSLCEKA